MFIVVFDSNMIHIVIDEHPLPPEQLILRDKLQLPILFPSDRSPLCGSNKSNRSNSSLVSLGIYWFLCGTYANDSYVAQILLRHDTEI